MKDRLDLHTTIKPECLKHIKQRALDESRKVNDILEDIIWQDMECVSGIKKPEKK